MISWVAAQFLYANASLLGHPVTVTTTNNHVYEGILHTVNPNPKDGYSVVLKHARKIKMGTNSPNSSTNNLSSSAAIPTLIITGKDFGMMTAKNITVNEEVSKRNKKGFQTDTAISGAKGTKERELQKWVPDPSVDTMLGLEDSTDGPWDQFAANESKFGLTTDYDEEIYTTPLNRESEDYKKRVKEAERIAREIEQSSATNVHVLEERGHELDDNIIDEEDRYGAVVRKPNALVQPPTRKQAPSSRPLRTSSFESRTTLSSSAGAAPVAATAAKDTGKLGDVKSGDKMFNQSMSSLDKKKQGFPLTKNASENPVSRVTLLEPVMQKTSTLPPTKDASSQPSQTTKYKPIEQTAIDRFNKYSESEKAAKDKASRDKVKRPPKAIPVVPKVPQPLIPEKRDEILAQFKEFSQTFKLKSECPDEIKTMFAKAKKGDESDDNQKKSEAEESEKPRTSEKTEEAKKKKADQAEKAKAGEKKDKAESKSFSFNLDAPAFVPSFTPSTSTTTTALPSPSSTSPANTPGSTYKVPPSPKYKSGYRGNREKRTGFFAGKELNREPVSIKKILKKTLERAMKPKDVAVSWPYGQPGRGYRSFFNAQPPPQDMGGYYNQGYPPAPNNYYYQQQQPTYPARGVPTTYTHMIPPPNVGAPLPPHMHNVPPYPGSPGMVPTNVNAGPVAVGPADYPHLHNVPPYPGVHNVPPPHIHSNTSGHSHNAPPYPQVHNNSSKPPRTPTSATAPSPHFQTPSQQPPPQHMPPHAQHPIPQHPGAPMPVPAPHYPPQSMPPHVPGQVPVPGMMPPNVPPHFYPPPPGPHQHGPNYPPPMYPQSYGPPPPNPNVVNGNGGGSQASQE